MSPRRMPSLRCLLAGLVLFAAALDGLLGEPSQQQQQQQRAASQSNELSQDSFVSSDGLVALNGFGRAYANNKRARKMSAFMPMRGRKDGRDQLVGVDALHRGRGQLDPAAALPLRESEPGDLALVRLVSSGGPPALEPRGRQLAAIPNAIPRQFIDQLVEDQLLGRGAGPSPARLMEAKYRRAFHPMRGKRADGGDGDALEVGGPESESADASWAASDDLFES